MFVEFEVKEHLCTQNHKDNSLIKRPFAYLCTPRTLELVPTAGELAPAALRGANADFAAAVRNDFPYL